MENPNLNEIVTAKLQKVRNCLSDLYEGLKDRWIATDTHLYQRVGDAIKNVEGVFADSFEDLTKPLEDYQATQAAYLASIVEVKQVKHPRTGKMVDLRIQKPQVKMAPSRREVLGYWDADRNAPASISTGPWLDHSNEELLAEHIDANAKNGNFLFDGKIVKNPFISDGVEAKITIDVK